MARFALVAILIALVGTIAAACTPQNTGPTTIPAAPAAVPTSIWSGLLQVSPYPFTTPLPPAEVSVLDGAYVQFDPGQGALSADVVATPTPPGGGAWMWHPVRPTVWVMPPGPYAVAGSGWRLHLDRGAYRIFHETTGWHTVGSFVVSAERVEFFNDPNCIQAVGVYTWKLEAGQLFLEPVSDECGSRATFQSGKGQRARVFASAPWLSCDSPSMEATPDACESFQLQADK